MPTARTVRSAALVALLVLVAAACSSDGGDASAEAADVASSDPIVLYTNDFEDIVGERFTADTGIDIQVVQESGGELLARVTAEGSNPQWDVVLFEGLGSLHGLAQDGHFATDVELSNLSNLTDEARQWLPDDGSYLPVGTASCIVAYRTDLVDNPPTSIDDLTDERFRGLVGQADPSVAAPAYPCVAAYFHDRGTEAAQELFQGLLDNDMRLFRTNGPTRQALEAGEIHVALLSAAQTLGLVADGEPIGYLWPDVGAPSSVRGVAVSSGTSNPEAAATFVDWLLTAETQQFLTDEAGQDGYFIASVDGVTELEHTPAGVSYYVVPADWAAEHEADIKSWFADRAVN